MIALLARWLNRRGVACYRRGVHDKARAYFSRVLTLCPELDDARYNLGLSLHALGRLGEAEATLRAYLASHPAAADVWNALALVLIERDEHAAALDCLRRAVELAPDHEEHHANLGQLLIDMHCWEEAREHLAKQVAQSPADAECHLRLGRVLLELGRNSEALACLDRASELDGGSAMACLLAGNALLRLGRYEEGERYLTQGLARAPASLDARGTLATLHLEMGEYKEAEALFRAADFGMSGMAVRKALSMPMFPDQAAEWEPARARCLLSLNSLRERGLRLQQPDIEVGMTNFKYAYQGLDNRAFHEQIAGFYRSVCPSLNWIAPHVGAATERGRLRLGVVSAYLLTEHSVGRVYGGMIECLSPERFDTTIFHIGKRMADLRYVGEEKIRSIHLPRNLDAVRTAIAAEKLDILVYTDIGMEPLTYFLAFSRLAPVQIVLAGHPDTTGIDSIDCFQSYRDAEPEAAAQHYSERLVPLAHSSLVYPAYRPDRRYVRSDFGLPETGRIYGCLQTPFKFHPDFDQALAEILDRDAQGYIVISESPWPRQCRVLVERLRRKLPDRGKRLIVLPHLDFARYLGLLDCCDVLLDTWHFGGGNTIFHGFAAGVPTITWPGDFMRGRIARWVYHQLRINDYIATDRAQYASLAVRSACDTDGRRAFDAAVRERAAEVFNQTGGIAQFEQFLLDSRLAQ